MCKIIVMANQKGGVAKTSSTRNLAYSLAELGKKVLAVDFDPQTNLTISFGVAPAVLQETAASLMMKLVMDEALPEKESYILNIGKVDLLPSKKTLTVAEVNLLIERKDECLAKLLAPLRADYDYILVDTGPKNLEVIKRYHSHVEADVPPEVHLLKVLEKHGLKPEDIDFIICTHLHWDHCQNNDCFPSKKVYTQKREVLYAINPVELHWYTYESPQCGLTPVWASAGTKLVVLDGDEEIIPGIEVFLTPGHTPGSQCVRVNTEDGYYLIAGDTVNIYENWEGNAKYHHVPAGIHVDLREYEETFKKMDKIDFKVILPGHDMKVLEHSVYPY